MRPVLHALAPDYAREEMPQPKRGLGPWGEAIQALLNERNLRQADLVKLAKIPPKTTSRITRGFDVNTKLLKRIAEALAVPFERVLVPPVRRWSTTDRRLLERMRDDLTHVLRSLETDALDTHPDPPDPAREIAARVKALTRDQQLTILEVVAQYEPAHPAKDDSVKDGHAKRRHRTAISPEASAPRRKRHKA